MRRSLFTIQQGSDQSGSQKSSDSRRSSGSQKSSGSRRSSDSRRSSGSQPPEKQPRLNLYTPSFKAKVRAVNKKNKIIKIIIYLILVAIVITGASLAYFYWIKPDYNKFTIINNDYK